MFEFRALDAADIEWQALDRFDDRVVFQTRAWLNFIAESQRATPIVAEIRDNGAVAGYFSGLVVRKFGVRILGSSFPGWTTPYIGFNLAPGRSRAPLLDPLMAWAFRGLKCLHVEVSDRSFQPEDGRGLDRTSYETYKSDLTRSENDLFNGMDSACRRCIRKAEKSGVVIEEAHDLAFADEYYEQLKDVFAKQGKLPTYPLERVRLLLKHLLPTGHLLAVRARNPDGKCIATGLYPGMNDTAFFWGNASWRTEQHWRPNEYLHWYALRYWKARGVKRFDWGGGGTYKEKYGVEPYVVPWFYKSRYRLLTTVRNEARALYYKSQRLVGRLSRVDTRAATAG
ncbi:MAG TPA: GNAT family N-acetyltransferase [Vicinamibacterales bacterium]|nr:GNAT family N-acetyltransferase [Vicinamibacterales bacterium]